jgi:hypothetical protein
VVEREPEHGSIRYGLGARPICPHGRAVVASKVDAVLVIKNPGVLDFRVPAPGEAVIEGDDGAARLAHLFEEA